MTPALRAQDVCDLMGIDFTAEQRAAIVAPPDAPVQIVAGAGSGKTTVMAARVVWLVGSGHVAPAEVLGLTFTAKASGELAGRIRTALSLLGPDPDEDGEPAVSTYHAYAGALVRDHGLRVGVEPDSRVLADATRFQLAATVVRAYDGSLPALRHAPTLVVPSLVSLESECSDHLADPDAVRAWSLELATDLEGRADLLTGVKGTKGRADFLRACAETARRRADLCLLVTAYRAAKRHRDVLDFGDQITLGLRIATECPEVRDGERARYRAVLLDEYQDTSVAQRMLLAALFGGGMGVTAVGDPCQAIYGWRGASVDNLVRFGEHFGGTNRLALTTSQRSGGRLLTLANRVSASLQARHPVAVLRARADKAELGEVVVARFPHLGEELAWVADQVRERFVGDTTVAVLLRTWRYVGDVHAALTAAGVPVEVVGLGGLLALPEVADLVAVLELIDDPTANASLLRLLAGPRWRLGARDLQALGRRASRLAGGTADEEVDPLEEAATGADPCDLVSLADALPDPGPGVSPEAASRFRAVGAELRELRRHAGEPLPDLVSRVMATTGLDIEVAASPAAERARRRESLSAFHDVVASYVGLDGEAGLRAFLAYLRAADDYDRGFDSALPTDAHAVQLLSMHKAKGLEWDVVVLPDLTDKTFPGKAGDRWPTALPVLPTRFRSDAASMPADPDWDARYAERDYKAAAVEHDDLDNDRLAYVAVTRARHTVIASTSVWGLTQKRPRLPSRYLLWLREHAEAGNGAVARWEPDADPKADNPYLVMPDLTWPAPLEPASLAARRAAADAVLAALDDPAAAVAAADRELDPAVFPSMFPSMFAAIDAELAALLDEARAARSTVVDVAIPTALTASQVLLLRADPDELARALARPMPARPAVAARRGTAFHTWVEQRFGVVPLIDPDEVPGAADPVVADGDLAALQAAFLATEWADRVPAAVEAPFAVLLGGRLVRGRIDAVYRDGDRWLVVDWKTGRERADPLQLAIYRTAWAARVGVADAEVDAAFLTVRTGQLERPALPSRAELDRLLA